ncbi:type B DNA-directed DNA polymerase [Methanocalculus taiwanensis]|uniref:DNA-directed DNA polymerase n=1 Tax=Methanocalculus taiwanensis TaxID=106207 RepID=A0ABD4TJ51_9EURY|nr:type B DNA-directed DNA polymerase [Methanocalculus taiwanensis]MCQ1538481.1 type B DNA-directed DNA polymerase [Methanocalculus taiwanensis]
MWILDTSADIGGIRFWGRDGESKRVAYTPAFLFTLDDPHLHRDMLDGLDERFGLSPCRVKTIFSEEEGYAIAASRKVAGLIEEQSRYSAKIYNLDLRPEQRFLAERGLTACALPGEDRFSPSFDRSLAMMEIGVADPPYRSRKVNSMSVDGKKITGSLPDMLGELAAALDDRNPDLILFPHADYWMPALVSSAEEHGILLFISRNGRYSRLSARSYWSYGRVVHREGALIPEGRCLIDAARSFTYRESGIAGVLLASRMTGLAPNLTARLTPGTLISGYENYEAIRRGIAVPFRKWHAEATRPIATLREADKGGMIFQPIPGVYDNVVQVDFTSMYPSIIVGKNLSPETVASGGDEGFLASVLAPVVGLRLKTKALKKVDKQYAGMDSLLKWMLVTSFGYTGYRNAKFGCIAVHEAITRHAREILIAAKECAEECGCHVLHGIVDSLWVAGGDIERFVRETEAATNIPTESEAYRWIAFLPMSDGTGAYNRYFGRLEDGTMKIRGVAARRGDTPPYIRRFQEEIFSVFERAECAAELPYLAGDVEELFHEAVSGLSSAAIADLVITRRVSRTEYKNRCIEGSAIRAYGMAGVAVEAGMEIGYVVRDGKRLVADPPWEAATADPAYYRVLLERAYEEVMPVFSWEKRGWQTR